MAPNSWISALVLFLPYVLLTVQWDDIQKSNTINTPHNHGKAVNTLLSARCGDTTTPDSMPVDLAAYYKYINLAARAIYDNHFEQASALYDTAFLHKSIPFYEDLKNYILLNAKCGLLSKNDAALHHLIIDKHVDTAQLFLNLPNRLFSKENLAVINKLVKAQKKFKYQETVFHRSLREMFALDQAFRDYDDISQKDYETRKAIYSRRDSVD